MGSSKKVTIGYRYYLGVHFTLCHGHVDALTHITVDERVAWSGSNAGGDFTVSNENLFGGEKREGGISGTFSFLPGSATQGQNSYLVSKLGSLVPAYRRVASIILNQAYVGTNPYMKRWAFRVRRIMKRSDGTAQWYSAKAAIGQDMNPAHIIRECLTDRDWGMGYLDSDIDNASFIAAADTLYSETFGMSILWDKEASVEDFIKEVLRHIDASLYVDKSTGLFTLYLVRPGYSTATLKVFDESSIVAVEDYACSTFDELSNAVTVNYWEASTGKNASVTVQDVALVQLQGGTISTTMEYGGVTNGTLAVRLASRDLRALSTPTTKCTIITSRKGAQVIPGEPVKVNWPDYGMVDMIMRVGAIDFGTATEGTVKLTLVQDVFSVSTTVYAPPANTEWQPVITGPQAATNRALIEAPYFTLVKGLGESEINAKLASLAGVGYVLPVASRPNSGSLYAQVMADAGAGYAEESRLDFCAMGVCSAIVTPTAVVIPLSSSVDMYSDMIAVGDYALLNSEFLEIVSFTQTEVTVKRGCLDSVPAQHAAGSKIYFMADFNGLGQTEFVSGETVNVKLLTTTGTGVLDIGTAPASSITMNQRALRPYPPGAWAISGSYFPSQLIDTPLTATWAHRSRTQQTGDALVDFTEGSIGPEAGTTYSLRLYNADTSALLYSVDGLTGTSHSGFPQMSGAYNLRMELWSVRSSLASLQKHSHTFYYENIYRLTVEGTSDHLLTEGDDTLTTE